MKSYEELKKENELLKEEIKELQNKICDLFDTMINLDTITIKELSDEIEELL